MNDSQEYLNRKIEHHRECALRYSLWVVCPIFPNDPPERKEKYKRSALGHYQEWQKYQRKKERLKKTEKILDT